MVFPDEGHWVLKPQNSASVVQQFHRLVGFLGEKVKIIIAVGSVVVVVILALLVFSTGSTLHMAPVKSIGVSTPVSVEIANPHGVRRVSAYVEQNGTRYPVFQQSAPAHAPVLEPASGAAPCGLRGRQEQGPEPQGRPRAPGGGGGFQRSAGVTTDTAAADVRRGAGGAARHPRRLAALHQPGRHGTGDFHARRARGARPASKWAAIRSAAFRCPASRPEPALCHVRLSLGPAAGRAARGLRPQPGGHGGHRRLLVQAVPQEVPRARFPHWTTR